MVKFLARRIVFMLLSLFLVSVAVFAVSELAPGNIAINTLGNTITPEQEQSFNAQNGLDQSPVTRYIRWLFGSDWQAAQLIGRPLRRINEADGRRYTWWVEAPDGTLYQSHTPDAEQVFRLVRQADGSTREEALGPEVWQPDANGFQVYWSVDKQGRAAMWVRGENLTAWIDQMAFSTSEAGAPKQYIPLQLGLLRGDPGISFLTRQPVGDALFPRLANTAVLALSAFVIVMPLALLLGLVAGLNEGAWIDRVLTLGGLITTGTPEFAGGVFLILIFSTWLKLLPGAVVLTSEGLTDLINNPAMLVLPVLTLTMAELGYVLRITRASMVEVMRTNYIRTAVLKGLPRPRIVFGHALRNALMAPITIIILHVNWLVGGIVVVESLFGFPGLGSYLLRAALFKDVFAIEAATMLLVIIAVGTQLVADIIYTYLNPRIRFD
jgi:peptide/nickel transport system permease protein